MSWIRLGDLITRSEWPIIKGDSIKVVDNLALRVFNTDIPTTEVTEFYVQSLPIVNDSEIYKILPEDVPKLGEYEILLFSKFLNPTNPVLCIVGSMGSGKSTTLRFLLGIYQKIFICTKNLENRKPLVAVIDFNQHSLLEHEDEEGIGRQLYRLIVYEFKARLNLIDWFTEEEEFLAFWNYEFELYKTQKSSSLAFRALTANLGYRASLNSTNQEETINQRKEVLSSISNETPLMFDYYIRLWRFIARTHYELMFGNGLVIFDNLDGLEPFIQKKLLEIIYTHAQKDGPTFILLVRPETFYQTGMGTGIIDVEHHSGPNPDKVVMDRIKRFNNNPSSYFSEFDGLSRQDFMNFVLFFRRIMDHCRTYQDNPFIRFIKLSSGTSIRTSLRISQHLFRANPIQLQNPDIQLHDLVRLCISGGPRQFNWSWRGPIENIFTVGGHYKNVYMVKPRILQYLAGHPSGRRRLIEITGTLKRFGYNDDLIISALNDLMRIQTQLIRTSGFDYYQTDRKWEDFSAHRVVLTEMGMGYRILFKELSYIQEVMLDSDVDGDHFPKEIGYRYLSDKFILLHQFLSELFRTDSIETSRFISAWGIEIYYDLFGTRLITLDILSSLYPSIKRILIAGVSKFSQYREIYEKVLQRSESLVLQVEAENESLLGISVDSVIEYQDYS